MSHATHFVGTADPPQSKRTHRASGLLRFADVMFLEGLTTTNPKEYARFLFGEREASDWEDQKPPEH
jgi:hypothetical protein